MKKSTANKSRVKRPKKPFVPNTKRTASIPIEAGPEAFAALVAVQAAYAGACNLLVPVVIDNRCWNRVALHNIAFHSDVNTARNHVRRGERMLAAGVEPMNSGRPRLIRVARRRRPSGEGRCNPPQCSRPADVVHHFSP